MSMKSLPPSQLRAAARQDLFGLLDGAAPNAKIRDILRTLERAGEPLTETRIHIEVERARRQELGILTEEFEERALEALDHLTAPRPRACPRHAADAIYRIADCLDLTRAVKHAFDASDLIPLERKWQFTADQEEEYAKELQVRLANDQYRPEIAYFTRAPKGRFASRPAASLAPADKIVFQALADTIEHLLEGALPATVLWPRSATPAVFPTAKEFATFPEDATEANYVVQADVESFFENVDHAILAYILERFVKAPPGFGTAVEAFLDVTMGANKGLPQGPTASNAFATAYLLPIDQAMAKKGWASRRYQDDLRVLAPNISAARGALLEIEIALRELGLRVSASKTGYVGATRLIRSRSRQRAQQKEPQGYGDGSLKDRINRHPESDPDSIHSLNSRLASLVSAFLADKTHTRLSHARTISELRRVLLDLAAAGPAQVPQQLGPMLDTFPALAPEAGHFLSSVDQARRHEVEKFLLERFQMRRTQEWENAWLALTPKLGKVDQASSFYDFYVDELLPNSTGALTKTCVLLVLLDGKAASGALMEAAQALPLPLFAELQLAMRDGAHLSGPLALGHEPGRLPQDPKFGPAT